MLEEEIDRCLERALLARLHLRVALSVALANGQILNHLRDRVLTRSPRMANPCVHPSQYVRSYPGAYLPFPSSSSAIFCFSAGKYSSVSHELIKIGFRDFSRSACIPARRSSASTEFGLGARQEAHLEIGGELKQRRMRHCNRRRHVV